MALLSPIGIHISSYGKKLGQVEGVSPSPKRVYLGLVTNSERLTRHMVYRVNLFDPKSSFVLMVHTNLRDNNIGKLLIDALW